MTELKVRIYEDTFQPPPADSAIDELMEIMEASSSKQDLKLYARVSKEEVDKIKLDLSKTQH
jgi:hypothetical protein